MRDVAHHAEIVRDEEIGDIEIALQIGEQIEDLRLHRNVKRRHRLVGDQQLRIEHQRARNRDALALPAGKHVRIAARMFGAQANFAQHVAHALAALLCAVLRVDDQRLFQDRLHGLARIERAIRILEHDLHFTAQVARLRGFGPTASRPSIRSVPAVGASIMVTMRASVDFPQPLSPTTASVRPGATSNEIPQTARSGKPECRNSAAPIS